MLFLMISHKFKLLSPPSSLQARSNLLYILSSVWVLRNLIEKYLKATFWDSKSTKSFYFLFDIKIGLNQGKALLSIPNGRYRYKIYLTMERFLQQKYNNDHRFLEKWHATFILHWNFLN